MKKKLSIGVILLGALLMFQIFPTTLGVTGSWTSTTPLPNPSSYHHSAVHDNRIYVVGGATPTPGELYDRVLYGEILANGHVDRWENTTPLPPDYTGQSERGNAPVVVYKDWLYVLDGSAERPPWRIERDTVSFAPIYANGSVGDWKWTTSMPYRGCEEALQWNGRIYIMAGWDGYSEYSDVWYAEINQTTGELDKGWNQTTSLPRQIAHGHATTVHNGVIYFIGGHEAYPEYQSPDVYYGIINASTGEVEEWIKTVSLPAPLNNHDAVAYGDDLFVIGGNIGFGNVSDIVYKAHINTNGSLSSWEVDQHLPEPLTAFASVVLNGRLYVIGGVRQDGTIVGTVYFKELLPKRGTMVFFNINPNPTTSGQTIILKGVLLDTATSPVVGLPNETVQVFARPIGGSWQPVTSLTTDNRGIFMWQVTIPWTTPPDTYIIVVYYPGSATYESSYNFDLLMIQ